MADNCFSLESWTFRSTFADSPWIADTFARETETLTRALQKSLSSDFDDLPLPEPAPVEDRRPTGHHPIPPSPTSRVSKRKSRATKRSPTTFITADPSNFRQMVQQVTGGRLGPVESMIKPEPLRSSNLTVQRYQSAAAGRMGGCLLPTLDTSAIQGGNQGGHVALSSPSDGTGADFEVFASFPTLESWGVM
ncbi:hypothetical protein QJS04_geneDACA015064 [Acorus gramineus]|uniref:VQ domain-containing protein n=1 Tax=Acorus gramineus TaxID=55184 RepID=A0AAV9BVC3_ACOGR|nr:hypothetical protein QJS04_geneDACA015064 [Acorus gramineus]